MDIENDLHSGFALVLAWPETKCKQAGAWYDYPLQLMNLNKNGYYKIGHAAIVLIDDHTKKCNYFDFGRYHAPHGFGRFRSKETDHDLGLQTTAEYDENYNILNVQEILAEIYPNKSTHGSGEIIGSLVRINHQTAMDQVFEMQAKDFMPYGPFIGEGINCSRFVRTVILAGEPSIWEYLKFKFPLTISPSPRWNLTATNSSLYSVGKKEEKQIIMNVIR
tara:strand:+ start:1160 stop:1819 length:660 start_codon:yes stop_codon:yes gene_type:complete